MSHGPEVDFDPYSLDEALALLTDRCRDCPFAEFIIALSIKESDDTEGPYPKIKTVEERCSGYEGPDRTSEYYSPFTDRSGCPLVVLLNEEDRP